MRCLISCGEPSGEAYAAGIAEHIRGLAPQAELAGLGEDRLAEAGVRLIARYGELAVIGVGGALRALRRLWQVRAAMLDALDRWRPDVLVCVDFKEFNLRLARQAKRRGIPVVFFVGPQLWAWRPSRAKDYAQAVDRLALLFPFEPKYYEGTGLWAEFVGHPRVRAAQKATPCWELFPRHGLDPARPLLLLQPGSRGNEIDALLPVMLAAWRLLRKEVPDLQAAVLAPAHRRHPRYQAAIAEGVPVVREDGMRWRKAARASLIASGTATLETALVGTPGAILYKLSPLNYWLAKRLVRVPYVGMPNILLNEEVMPELLQHEATPQAAAAAVRAWLQDPDARAAATRKLLTLSQMLSTGRDPLQRVAEMACELAGARGLTEQAGG